jgi:CheY-like chemotaxis protein
MRAARVSQTAGPPGARPEYLGPELGFRTCRRRLRDLSYPCRVSRVAASLRDGVRYGAIQSFRGGVQCSQRRQDSGGARPAGERAASEVGPDDDRARIFDPFFTTKSAGRGMGLSVVQGIVKAHQGSIHVTSTPGQGTTFRILLPSTAESAKQKPNDDPAASLNQSRFGSVLMVEDEEPLRLSVSKVLRSRGFTVIQAADGSAAVDVIRGQERFDLVLLDRSSSRQRT